MRHLFRTLILCLAFNCYGSDLFVTGFEGTFRYDGRTGSFIGVFAGEGTQAIFGPDGNLYVRQRPARVYRFNGITGAFIDVFVKDGSGGLVQPAGLAFGPDRNLYIGDVANKAVLRFDEIVRISVESSGSGFHTLGSSGHLGNSFL